MGINLNRFIDKFGFAEEAREAFVKNLEGLARTASEKTEPFPFHPEYFWGEDLTGWEPEDRDRLLSWLYKEAKEAAEMSTADYDYSVAPDTCEELEEEVDMIQYAAAIFRIWELRNRYHISAVLTDQNGAPYRRYLEGKVVHIK